LGDPSHGPRRPYHQPLGTSDFIREPFLVAARLLSEREQPHVYSQQRLCDFILEFAADIFAFVLLRGQKPMRQLAKSFLQLERFFQAFVVQFATLFVRILHDLAFDRSPSQLSIGGVEFCGTMGERFRELPRMDCGLPRAAPRLFDGSICFPEKYPGPRGHDGCRHVRTAHPSKARECLLVHPGQIQRFQPGCQCLASQSQCGLQARVNACLQVFSQRSQISPGESDGFIVHCVSTERGETRTEGFQSPTGS
jgi:hypothetical protein